MKLCIVICLVTLVTGEGSVTNIVQREGAETTMSCLLPSDTAWESCMFQHDSQDCVLTADQSNQPCPFQDSQLHVTPDGLCQLVIADIQVSPNILLSSVRGQGVTTYYLSIRVKGGKRRWKIRLRL